MYMMEIEDKVKKVFFDIFSNLNNENFDWNAKQEDYLNWDSFAHLELITASETKFNIKISPEDSLSIRTALDLTKLIQSRI